MFATRKPGIPIIIYLKKEYRGLQVVLPRTGDAVQPFSVPREVVDLRFLDIISCFLSSYKYPCLPDSILAIKNYKKTV